MRRAIAGVRGGRAPTADTSNAERSSVIVGLDGAEGAARQDACRLAMEKLTGFAERVEVGRRPRRLRRSAARRPSWRSARTVAHQGKRWWAAAVGRGRSSIGEDGARHDRFAEPSRSGAPGIALVGSCRLGWSAGFGRPTRQRLALERSTAATLAGTEIDARQLLDDVAPAVRRGGALLGGLAGV